MVRSEEVSPHSLPVCCGQRWRSPGAQVKPRYAGLPNFHQVNQQLYRGGLPKDGGLRRLRDLGVKTIMNWRGEDVLTRADYQFQ